MQAEERVRLGGDDGKNNGRGPCSRMPASRARVIKLLRQAGIEVYQRTLTYQEVMDADEVFSTGNYGRVIPVSNIEGRHLQPGPVFQLARRHYWDFAHGK